MATANNDQHANGNDLFHWFLSGATELYAHVKHLNLINVFPVADGDTGTNLAVTLRAMVESAKPVESFNRTLQAISQSALEGARGNSGTIFAAYISGLAIESDSYQSVTPEEFSGIASQAVKHLYSAVENPMEGTLMSVIRDWAQYLQHNKGRFQRFNELFHSAYHYAVGLLEKTKTQLDVLRKNNVVDAGAAGFVRFLEGINRVFSGNQSIETVAEEPFTAILTEEDTSAYRYCTEALVGLRAGLAADPDAFAKTVQGELDRYGDSLIAGARGGKLKVHIHTNTPELVMEALEGYGELLSQKADDMHLQSRLRAKASGGIGLVTDSIADLPDAFLLEHNVTVLPMGVLKGTTAYLDKLTIKLRQLFRVMDEQGAYPSTSMPEPARIRAMLSAAQERFDSLIVLSVADKLSGTYQAVLKAAQALSTPGKPITVVDTRLNSGAQGLLVKHAADMIEAGASQDEILTEIQSRIPRTKIYVCLNTLYYAARGGRVPNTVGQIGMKLKMRPIMTLDKTGHGAAFGVAFSQKGLTRKIMRLVRKTMQRGGIAAYSIVHGDNLPLAKAYAQELTRITGQPPEFISEISAAVAIHSGPGTVAVCVTAKEGATV